ncbi:MAG: FkbM family methyltransferase [Leptolyngbyaceae cyanobacterium RU_5_1]|nr:FkbM family methyltransferase [Leptolyngbyaceae cyanobacterium RU_5_1]
MNGSVKNWCIPLLNGRLNKELLRVVRLEMSIGFEVFLTSNALRINASRLGHLASLQLEIAGKRVLEVGAGIGLLTGFFEELGCSVLTTDGRPENVAEMRRQFPHRQAEVLDLEAVSDITHLGTFDIIFCYGTLYHLSKPEQAITAMSQVCRELLLLETCVTPGDDFAVNLASENQDNPNQAFSGMGCRPTRPWIMQMLRNQLGFAYTTKSQPFYYDFDLDWQSPLPKSLHRAVFIGSRTPLKNDQLLEELPAKQVYSLASDQTRVEELLVLVEELTNTAYLTQRLESLSSRGILALAEALAIHHSLAPYPAWYFNTEWTAVDSQAACRQTICDYIKTNGLEDRIKVGWYHNLQLYLNLSAPLDSQLFINGFYQPNQFYFFSRVIRPNGVFLDLGAGQGLYSLFASHYVGSDGLVVLFEPDNQAFKLAKKNLALNGVVNVNFLGEAHSDSGEIEGSKIGNEAIPKSILNGSTLDQVLLGLEAYEIDVARINLQVEESILLQVLKVLLGKSQPLLVMELAGDLLPDRKGDPSEILQLLKSAGYEIFSFSQFSCLPIKMADNSLLSTTVIAAHPDNVWDGLTELEQMQNRELELEQAQLQLQDTQAKLEQLQSQFSQVQSELVRSQGDCEQYKTNCEQLQSQLSKAEMELQATNTHLRQTQGLVENLQGTIAAMETTKFWKLRGVWFGLKDVFGMQEKK